MSAAETVVEAVTQPSPSPASPVAARRPSTFAGLTSAQLALVALAILLAIWGMWVTRALVAPREQHIVKADLSRIEIGRAHV